LEQKKGERRQFAEQNSEKGGSLRSKTVRTEAVWSKKVIKEAVCGAKKMRKEAVWSKKNEKGGSGAKK
jgi:hypothetical protein